MAALAFPRMAFPRTKRVDPSVHSLDAEHAANGGWTPSSMQIRPSPAIKARKTNVMAAVLENYSTPADYVLNLLFESISPVMQDARTGKLSVTRSSMATSAPPRLVRSEFSYDVHPDTNHYILWYAVAERPPSLRDTDISSTIDQLLCVIAGNDQFEAIWYENPKMTVPGVFHVQVFWRHKPTSSGMNATMVAASTAAAVVGECKAGNGSWTKSSMELSARINEMQKRHTQRRQDTVPPHLSRAYAAACDLCVRTKDPRKDDSGVRPEGDATGGELHVDAVYSLIDTCLAMQGKFPADTPPPSTLLDLGSGTGKVVLIASLFLDQTTGVELVNARHAQALALRDKFEKIAAPLVEPKGSWRRNTRLIFGDMFGKATWSNSLSDSSSSCGGGGGSGGDSFSWSGFGIVYACSTCFSLSLVARIAEKAERELDPGALLCTVTKPLNIASNGSQGRLVLAHKVKLHFSWGEETVFIYRADTRQHDKNRQVKDVQMSPAEKLNRAGSVLQDLGFCEKAIRQYRAALKADAKHAPSHFNMATCLCDLAERSESNRIATVFRRKARVHYQKAADCSPEGFGEAHSNLAVLFLKEDMLDEALASCEMALQLHSVGSPPFCKAFWNLSSVLRRMGRKGEAIGRAWSTIASAATLLQDVDIPRPFERPAPINIAQEISNDNVTTCTAVIPSSHISVVCVKWGTKYGPEYVLRLFAGVQRFLSWNYTFYCFTEDTSGLEGEPGVHTVPLMEGWNGWWNKASLFSTSCPLSGRVLYIDLDTVVTGPLDSLASYRGDFAILSTNDIDNEGKDFCDGYNSSVLLWDADSPRLGIICDFLATNFALIHKFIHRLDHWFEMMVSRADTIQGMFPGQIVDYNHSCKENVPDNARIVVFPLRPKPHEFPSEWIRSAWLTDVERESVELLTSLGGPRLRG